MTYFMVDVEADGPIPGDYSMFALGCVVVDEKCGTPERRGFLRWIRPMSDKWEPTGYELSNTTREAMMTGENTVEAKQAMEEFASWIKENTPKGQRPMFISDNNGYDFMWVCWYFWHFTGGCPFGHSSTNLGSLYKGIVRDTFKNFKHLRKTVHDHNPLNDAAGNAEALLEMRGMRLKIAL